MPDLENLGDDGAGDGDSDYEAELAAITAGDNKVEKRNRPKPVAQADLDKMVAESLRDIGLFTLLILLDNDYFSNNIFRLKVFHHFFKVPTKSCLETMMIQIC